MKSNIVFKKIVYIRRTLEVDPKQKCQPFAYFINCCPSSLDLSTKNVFFSTKLVLLVGDHHRISGDGGRGGGSLPGNCALLNDLNICSFALYFSTLS